MKPKFEIGDFANFKSDPNANVYIEIKSIKYHEPDLFDNSEYFEYEDSLGIWHREDTLDTFRGKRLTIKEYLVVYKKTVDYNYQKSKIKKIVRYEGTCDNARNRYGNCL